MRPSSLRKSAAQNNANSTGFYMVPHIVTKADLVAMLSWQHDMGADEALLDHPDLGRHSRRNEDLLSVPTQSAEHTGVAPPAMPQDTQSVAASDSGHAYWVKMANSLGIDDFSALRAGLENLDGCALKHTASNLCFADGNAGARLMIIGEVPGRDEDRMGVPFVGAAGQLLDRMLACIGLDRATVYLTNLLPWRPPGNRTPTDEEIAMLMPWLYRHIQLANPQMLVLLGGVTAKLILGKSEGILKLRGTWHDIDFGDGVTRPVLASLHPSYLIRSPAQKRLAFEDLQAIAARF